MKEQWGIELADHIVQDIFRRDIYEIPFEQNVKLITGKWQDFTQNVLSTNDDCITIFESCFIQNPLTMGLVKFNQSKEQKEWSEGFINYYTNQGLGQAQDYQGVEGTVQVLQERSWSPKSMGYFKWIRYGWIIRIMTARLVGTS